MEKERERVIKPFPMAVKVGYKVFSVFKIRSNENLLACIYQETRACGYTACRKDEQKYCKILEQTIRICIGKNSLQQKCEKSIVLVEILPTECINIMYL